MLSNFGGVEPQSTSDVTLEVKYDPKLILSYKLELRQMPYKKNDAPL